jgi:hypothetical protein
MTCNGDPCCGARRNSPQRPAVRRARAAPVQRHGPVTSPCRKCQAWCGWAYGGRRCLRVAIGDLLPVVVRPTMGTDGDGEEGIQSAKAKSRLG